ncbi:MAG TPA: hypothetical protein VFX38_02315 [Gammaproteobacteria bacterium]|nr:hypothetical protein [Gammaproteobacteria bacterium]
MNDRVASSKGLGFGVFAIASWLMSMGGAGFMPQAYGGNPSHLVLSVAMIGLLIAAIAAFLRHETWYAFFFMLWSAVSWGLGGGHMGAAAGLAPLAPLGWFWLAIAFVNLYLWLAAMRAELGPAVSLTVLLVSLTMIGLGLQGVLGIGVAGRIGSYLGLATALVAFYVSAEAIMNRGGRGARASDGPPVI